MSVFEALLVQVSDWSNLVGVGVDEEFDFASQDYAFLIESGAVLAYGEKDRETGIKATQTFGVHDPIGFAEAIAVRDIRLEFRKLSDLTLIKFDSAELRKQVNSANVLAKTIIKYSLSRIFDSKRSANNFSFEDEFINKNYRFLTRMRVAQEEEVFRVNGDAQRMFFIEKGLVEIVSETNKILADLGIGECFGEAANGMAGIRPQMTKTRGGIQFFCRGSAFQVPDQSGSRPWIARALLPQQRFSPKRVQRHSNDHVRMQAHGSQQTHHNSSIA